MAGVLVAGGIRAGEYIFGNQVFSWAAGPGVQRAGLLT
jgi:hypothetical protein